MILTLSTHRCYAAAAQGDTDLALKADCAAALYNLAEEPANCRVSPCAQHYMPKPAGRSSDRLHTRQILALQTALHI